LIWLKENPKENHQNDIVSKAIPVRVEKSQDIPVVGSRFNAPVRSASSATSIASYNPSLRNISISDRSIWTLYYSIFTHERVGG